jgi:hypothetical protein
MGSFYLTCTTHVNLMGSHIVRSLFVSDLNYKLAQKMAVSAAETCRHALTKL